MKKNLLKRFLVYGHFEKLRKTLIMANLFFFLAIFNMQLQASVLNQQMVSLSLQDASLYEMFESIEKQTEVGFLYNESEINTTEKITVEVSHEPLGVVLSNVLPDLGIDFEIDESVIILKPGRVEKVFAEPVLQVKIKITGKVTDKEGNTLPGATIMEEGTLNGVTSDINGVFKIDVDGSASVLKISFIGFKPQLIAVGDKTEFDIILDVSSSSLGEVVVIGYGTTNRERIGSAIAQINAVDIEKRSAGLVNIEDILGGNIKGLYVSQSSGALGASSSFNIRGITSPFGQSANQPLFVIDGVPFNTDASFDVGIDHSITENPLLSINPSDIESISVLKDAGATAIYGSRGANGVVIITTKRGRKDSKPSISFNYGQTFANPTKLQSLLDADGFKALHTMVAKNTIDAYNNGFASYSAYKMARLIMDPNNYQVNESIYNTRTGENIPLFGNANTNWQNEIYRRNAKAERLDFTVSGGSNKTTYVISLSHSNQQALVINEYLKRYGVRVGLDSEVSNWLKVGTTMNYSKNKNYGAMSTSGAGSISDSYFARPDYPVYSSENAAFQRIPETWSARGIGTGYWRNNNSNPVAGMENENLSNSSSFIGNAYLEINILKGLKFRSDINTGIFNTVNSSFKPKRAFAESTSYERYNSLSNSLSESEHISVNYQLLYSKTIKDHAFNGMLGYTQDRSFYHRESQQYSNTPDDYILINAASALAKDNATGSKAQSGINSIYARLQYAYTNKYTAVLNFRTDESSKFGPANKRAYFPSLALNWNIHEEKFMDNISVVNNLKLRGSIGRTGSANVNDFNYLQFFEVGSRNYGIYGGEASIIPLLSFPNREIRWETTTEFNFGLDFIILSNRIYGSIDAYRKYTDGILTPTPIYLESGATSFTSNLSEISNTGMEFEIGADLIQTKDFQWTINFNIAFNRNKVESMEGSTLNLDELDNIIGHPYGTLKGFIVEKILQEEDVELITTLNSASPTGRYFSPSMGPGDYLYKDISGDGRINADDYTVLGSMQPDYFGGFSTNLRYKNLSFFAGFQYTVGNEKQWNDFSKMLDYPSIFQNMSPEALTETWTPENPDAKYSRLVYYNYFNRIPSDRNIQDASYLRCKIIRLTYTLSDNLIRKTPFKNINVYISGTNLFTITKYKGLDPESSFAGKLTGTNRDDSTYPFAKSFTFGVKIGF